MPFEDDNDDSSLDDYKNRKQNSKKVNSNTTSQKTNKEEFEKRVRQIQENKDNYKSRASDLAIKFKKMMSDKTLADNRNIFVNDMENEVVSDMVNLAMQLNEDPDEIEGTGSIMWIVLMLKIFLYQRDKINQLEYNLSKLTSKVESV